MSSINHPRFWNSLVRGHPIWAAARRRTGRLVLVLTAASLLASALLVSEAGAAASTNQYFQRTWERTDQPVAAGKVSRTWMWGPKGNTDVMHEPYAESPGGTRTVQYFDKSRMEITHPGDDSSSIWYVTNGLLVVELISGQLQVGDASFEPRSPAIINVAGDADDASGPTYATFGELLDDAPRTVGSIITQRVDRDANVSADPALAGEGVTVEIVDDVTHHAIAKPFWAFMTSSGPIYEDGQYGTDLLFEDSYFATGRPITEAYWAEVKVGGSYRDVLVQCFERRCLTYTPGNPSGWQVEAGNVGQHYYLWRYGQEPGGDPTPTPEPTPEPPVTDYEYFDTWANQLNGTAAFNAPVGIAVDPLGRVYVAESGEHDVQRFNTDGVMLGGFGALGAGAGQIDRPEGLATDSNGMVYVADFNNDRVQMFFDDGGYFGEVANATYQGLNGPMDVAVHVTPGATADDTIHRIYIVDQLNNRIVIRTVTSPHRHVPGVEDYPLLTFGSYGSGNGQFANPNGIGLDAAGNVYVADTGNNRIQKFSPDGEWIVSFGTAGKGEGQFTYPRDVLVSADGRSVYVANSGDQNGGASIKVWELLKGNSDYDFDFEWGSSGAGPGQFNYPARIAMDQQSNVYVTELLNHRVQKFTAGGNWLDVWTDASQGSFGRPVEITYGGGVLYVVDKELAQIKRFTPDGQFIDQWSDQLQVPVDVAVRGGDAYVVDQAQNKVLKFTTNGEYVKSWGGPGSADGQFSKLEGVAIDDHGYVYVIDNGNYRIQKFTADGAFVTSWGSYGTGPGQFENSKGIAIHDDALYVVDFFPGRVQQFDLDGTYVREFGGQGDAPGKLDGPYDVTVDAGGYVYVADRDNHRIQKFTAEGTFVALLDPETAYMPAYASPSAVAVSSAGTVYAVTDRDEGIMVFQPAPIS